jgi:MoaA/NifB/PqqE/SkfB family radical SAM enzyme
MQRSLPVIPSNRIVHPPPPSPNEGVVSWNMNTLCNYRCSYCTQRFLDDRKRWAKDIPAFIEAFGQLPVQTGVPWEIKLSGGEPFLHPDFVDVVRALVSRGLYISVVTNFSQHHLIEPFLEAAGHHLRILSCSLHVEFADIDAFIARAKEVQRRIVSAPSSSLVVTCVATRANLAHLESWSARFDAAGLRLKVQPEKQNRDIVDYDTLAKDTLYRLGGHNGTGHIAHDFGGQPCWAGARYFIVDDRGDAFRCYPARRYRSESLGNVVSGTLRLHEAVQPCLYRSCHCTVPIARRMMPTDAVIDRFEEHS